MQRTQVPGDGRARHASVERCRSMPWRRKSGPGDGVIGWQMVGIFRCQDLGERGPGRQAPSISRAGVGAGSMPSSIMSIILSASTIRSRHSTATAREYSHPIREAADTGSMK